ncbi:MAG: LCP family protein [bacterium]
MFTWKNFFIGAGFILSLIIITSLLFVYIVAHQPEIVFSLAFGDSVDEETFNLIILGFDEPFLNVQPNSIARPDVIAVAAIDFTDKTVRILNLPRDTLVYIPAANDYDKLNHAFGHGFRESGDNHFAPRQGLNATFEAVRRLLGGVPVHNYLSLDLGAARNVFEAVGEVGFVVEEEVISNEGEVVFGAGEQLTTSDEIESYIRRRKGLFKSGDLDRIERQQKFINQMVSKLGFFDYLRISNSLLEVWEENFITDLDMRQFFALGVLSLHLSTKRVETYTLTGFDQNFDQNGNNIWYFILDEEERRKTVKEVFGDNTKLDPSQILLKPPALLPGNKFFGS